MKIPEKSLNFLYDGKPFEPESTRVIRENGRVTTIYLLDGLVITNIVREIPEFDAFETVNFFENMSDSPSGIISELFDCDVTLPLEHEEPRKYGAYIPDIESATKISNPLGSVWDAYEGSSDPDKYSGNGFPAHIHPGETKKLANRGGRSSDGWAPFVNIHKSRHGYIYAIGWTGQWNFYITRGSDDIRMRSKLEDTNFRILPGEKFRTSSAVVMEYDGDMIDSQNKWRRLVKKHFSLIGKPGREDHGPFCASIWGGMTTEAALERVRTIKKSGIPYEYIWMDAGWYGENVKATPDEFEGDWAQHTGDWVVSPLIHPDGLVEFSRGVHEAGMKFVLWFEPERVISGTPITVAHPEYFLKNGDPNTKNLLLNLGDDDAWSYIFGTLSKLIETIGVDCYRQDFNFEPLSYWRHNDADDRRGISEIKHINGMYRLWDSLLEKFPRLLIDNCASGGRRIDIETLRRSMPLWRSDYECPANFPVSGAQAHHLGFNSWMPFSGTGSGREYDTYRIRSAYDTSMTTNYFYSQRNDLPDESKLAWLKARGEEYLRLRPYFSEDFYPLTVVSDKSDVWSAAQFDRPESGDGIVQAFRREDSPYVECEFRLRGIDRGADYEVTDLDHPENVRILSGCELADFRVRLEEKRSSAIFIYRRK